MDINESNSIKVKKKLNEVQVGDTVIFDKQKGYVIGKTYDDNYIIQVQGSSHLAKSNEVESVKKEEPTQKPPFKFDKLTLQNLTTKALFEQYVRCGIYMGSVPVKLNNCYTKYSDWNDAENEKDISVLVEGSVSLLPKSQIRILEDVNNFANLDNYIEGVEVDETGEAISNVMINAIDYTEAIGDAEPVRIIRGDGVSEPTVDTVPKGALKTLSI